MRCQTCDYDEFTPSEFNNYEGYPTNTRVGWSESLEQFVCTVCVNRIRKNVRYYKRAWTEKDHES